MARRNDTTDRPIDRVGIRLELDTSTRDRLRIRAAEAGLSMASYVRDLVERHLAEPPKKSR